MESGKDEIPASTALILELPTRDMLNSIFNKRVIGGLIFNCYLSNAIILHKTVLEGYIKGEKPLPPNFVDTPMPYPLQYPHDNTRNAGSDASA